MGGRTPLILSKHAACQTVQRRDLQARAEVTLSGLAPLGGSGLDSFRSDLLQLTVCAGGGGPRAP